MTVIDTLAGLASDSRETTREIIRRRPVSVGMAGYFIGALSLFVMHGMNLSIHSLSGGFFLLAVLFFIQVLAGIVFASIIHLFMEAWGHRGDAAGLFVIFGISDIAWTLLVPALIVQSFLIAGRGYGTLVILFVTGIHLYVRTLCVGSVYNAGKWKSFFAVVMPYVVICACLAAISVFSLTWLVMKLSF